jgi:hypothetical protein
MNELRSKYFSIDFDPSIIFHNELSQSIKQFRQQYQQQIQHEKNFLHKKYLISFYQFIIKKQKLHHENFQFNKDNQQQNKLHEQILRTKIKNFYLKEKNQYLNDQINQIQISINHLNEKSQQIFLLYQFEFYFI